MAKVRFAAVDKVSDQHLRRNREYTRSLDLPRVGEREAAGTRLAVVGGAPDVGDHLDELRSWAGEVWAINDAWGWVTDRGVDAAFYQIDPMPLSASIYGLSGRTQRAIVADTIHPSVYKALSGADVQVAYIGEGEGELPNASTAAATAPIIAATCGHTDVTFFGCGGSFEDRTHAYQKQGDDKDRLRVRCGGESFLTTPQFVLQTEYIAELSRGLPGFISARGEGFLPALLEHGDYDVTHVSRALDAQLRAAA